MHLFYCSSSTSSEIYPLYSRIITRGRYCQMSRYRLDIRTSNCLIGQISKSRFSKISLHGFAICGERFELLLYNEISASNATGMGRRRVRKQRLQCQHYYRNSPRKMRSTYKHAWYWLNWEFVNLSSNVQISVGYKDEQLPNWTDF